MKLKSQYILIMSVDISGLDKDKLFENLWKNSKVSEYYTTNNISQPEWDLDQAKIECMSDGFANSILGRMMKVMIYNTDEVDPERYNDYNGENKYQEVVNNMRGEIEI